MPHSTALQATLDGRAYLTGPLARYALNYATLSPLANVFITAVQQNDASEFILEHSAIFAADDKLAAAS